MSANHKLEYRPDIDGMRALAILSVLMYHLYPESLPGGFIGVDIFFLISGYLITKIISRSLEQGGFSFVEFYSNRIIRLFPALSIVLVSCFIAGWQILTPSELRNFGAQLVSSVGFYQNIALWKSADYFNTTSEQNPLLHLWSLGIEEQFYAILPSTLYIAFKAGINRIVFPFMLATISFWLNIKLIQINTTDAFYLPYSRFWELLSGSILATAEEKEISLKPLLLYFPVKHKGRLKKTFQTVAELAPYLGLAIILLSITHIDGTMKFPGWVATLPVIGSILVITSNTNCKLKRYILRNKALIWIGLISYPLYLWHWPITVFAKLAINGVLPYEKRALILLASIVLATLTRLCIEQPLKSCRNHRNKTLILIFIMAIIGTLGYATKRNNGFKKRYPEIISQIIGYGFDYKELYRLNECLIGKEQAFTDFNEYCFASQEITTSESQKTRVLIWGDSYGAHLYPGLKAVNNQTSSVSQLTSSACAPILEKPNERRPNCLKTNDLIFQSISQEKYDSIVIAANWEGYPSIDGLDYTLRKLAAKDIKHIFLFGPPPHWNNKLPRELFNHFINNRYEPVPYRLSSGLSDKTHELDLRLSEIAKSAGVNYISILNLLCNDAGCLARTGDSSESLISFDEGHLSEAGSIEIFNRLKEKSDYFGTQKTK